MQPLARITPATVDVLTSLIESVGSASGSWGLRIIKQSSRPPGTVYPILERLERAGWVKSAWEDDDQRPGPRRRLYTLTQDGEIAARETVRSFRANARSAARPLTASAVHA